jgi:hypothetical protein
MAAVFPFWSPDGSRILGYVDHGFGGADSIAVLDPTGQNSQVDIPLPGRAAHPANGCS